MIALVANAHVIRPIVGHVCEYASAVFGILGTFRMSRRFCPQIWRSIFYAASWPFIWVAGKGEHAKEFFAARAQINWDVPDSPIDMALGLNLLFWAFILQLASLILK